MALSVSIDLVSSSARVTSVKFQKHHSVTEGHPDTKIGPGTPGSDKNARKAFLSSIRRKEIAFWFEDIWQLYIRIVELMVV